jgi:NADH-quinone oxidoreductase subunit N
MMNFDSLPDFVPQLPEIFVLAMACVILLLDVFVREERRMLRLSADPGDAAGCGGLIASGHQRAAGAVLTFSGMFVDDPMADVLKLMILFLRSRWC